MTWLFSILIGLAVAFPTAHAVQQHTLSHGTGLAAGLLAWVLAGGVAHYLLSLL